MLNCVLRAISMALPPGVGMIASKIAKGLMQTRMAGLTAKRAVGAIGIMNNAFNTSVTAGQAFPRRLAR